MNTQTGFILKVLVLSIVLSWAIKYVAPSFAIPTTNLNALIGVLLPTVMMAIALSWRALRAGA
ncbi:MAG TPA: hypothetical protein V6C57_27680 [Coleofasciculaceae cyanobacterium]